MNVTMVYSEIGKIIETPIQKPCPIVDAVPMLKKKNQTQEFWTPQLAGPRPCCSQDGKKKKKI